MKRLILALCVSVVACGPDLPTGGGPSFAGTYCLKSHNGQLLPTMMGDVELINGYLRLFNGESGGLQYEDEAQVRENGVDSTINLLGAPGLVTFETSQTLRFGAQGRAEIVGDSLVLERLPAGADTWTYRLGGFCE